jgi:hypothetical protein
MNICFGCIIEKNAYFDDNDDDELEFKQSALKRVILLTITCILNMNNTTGDTSGTGTTYPSVTTEFNH